MTYKKEISAETADISWNRRGQSGPDQASRIFIIRTAASRNRAIPMENRAMRTPSQRSFGNRLNMGNPPEKEPFSDHSAENGKDGDSEGNQILFQSWLIL